MSFVNEVVKEKADKCGKCAFMKIRAIKLDRHSVLYDEATMAMHGLIEGLNRATCNVCPNCKDFEKIYGSKPYEYYKMD